jgi:hypothetical protein
MRIGRRFCGERNGFLPLGSARGFALRAEGGREEYNILKKHEKHPQEQNLRRNVFPLHARSLVPLVKTRDFGMTPKY